MFSDDEPDFDDDIVNSYQLQYAYLFGLLAKGDGF